MGCHVVLLKLYSMGIWRKLLALLDADGDGVVTTEELKALDIDGDGKLSKVRSLGLCLRNNAYLHCSKKNSLCALIFRNILSTG